MICNFDILINIQRKTNAVDFNCGFKLVIVLEERVFKAVGGAEHAMKGMIN